MTEQIPVKWWGYDDEVTDIDKVNPYRTERGATVALSKDSLHVPVMKKENKMMVVS